MPGKNAQHKQVGSHLQCKCQQLLIIKSDKKRTQKERSLLNVLRAIDGRNQGGGGFLDEVFG